jgi:hypothetical protein
MEKPPFNCSICNAPYLREDLKQTCEKKPIEDLFMKYGSVFKCKEGIIGVLYDSKTSEQTHERTYEILRISPCHSMAVPQIFVGKKDLESAISIDNETFTATCKYLEKRLEKAEDNQDHTQKLKNLKLIRYVKS